MTTKKRVAIIGGGPCGISMMSAFRHAEINGSDIPEIVCFEKQAELGGLWNLSWRTGLDEHGEHSHSSMYRHLWSNGPKEGLEMADYNFDEHFKTDIPSFPPRLVLRDYILGKARKYDVQRFVKTNTVVRSVAEINETQFSVTYEDIKNCRNSTEVFDYVVVAVGHFTVPHFPSYDGIGEFDGRILHAHDFYNPTEFANQSIVIVGSSYSAEDIALQLHKYGANKITIVYRKKPMGYKWPDNIKEVKGLINIDKNRCYFNDGSHVHTDAIIFCTGYLYYFPFMEEKLRLRSENSFYPKQLYKGVLLDVNPRVCYLGMQDQCWTFTLFDSEAWYVRDYILGKLDIGTPDSRSEDIKAWHTRCMNIKTVEECVKFQKDFVVDLFQATDYPKHDNSLKENIFYQWLKDKKENILTYRDKQFNSIISGRMAPLLKVPWVKAMDDSLEAFLNNSYE